MFVQPKSEQQCLLGMNVLSGLGLAITRANGEPLITKHDPRHKLAQVRLVQSVPIPSIKGQFLESGVDHGEVGYGIPPGCQVLFEPQAGV